MEQQQSHQKDNKEMLDMNIKEFLDAARQHLLGILPTQQPTLANIPAHRSR